MVPNLLYNKIIYVRWHSLNLSLQSNLLNTLHANIPLYFMLYKIFSSFKLFLDQIQLQNHNKKWKNLH